jgi:hypothetical protein
LALLDRAFHSEAVFWSVPHLSEISDLSLSGVNNDESKRLNKVFFDTSYEYTAEREAL